MPRPALRGGIQRAVRGGFCFRDLGQGCKEATMQTRNPEDEFIRRLILLAATGTAIGLLAVVLIITVMVSANFTILNWME